MREKRKKDREVELRGLEKNTEKSKKIKEPTPSGKSKKEEKSKESLLVGPKVRKVLLVKRKLLYALSTNMLHACSSFVISLPTSMTTLLKEFKDVFPDDISSGLPPLRGIEHHINLSPRASLPNKATYWTNPKEGKEIQKQVRKFLEK
ncbi:hypothetical protein CR513_24854, partial [Mucuna pruriens]